MILYLTYWFPAARLARFVGLFMTAVPLASAIGAPLSSFILGADGVLGLKGWQWLFIIEGLPSCVLGLVTLPVLPDRPAQAKWLTAQERATIIARLADDRARNRRPTHHALWPALIDRRVLLLSLVYFGIVLGLYGIGLWLPQVIRDMDFSIMQVGLLTALPYVVSSAAGMLFWGRHSDRCGERVWHVALPAMMSAAGLLAAIYSIEPADSLRARHRDRRHLCDARSVLEDAADVPRQHGAAGGIALINSIGSLGGFLGPSIVGGTKELTQDFHAGMAVLAMGLAGAASAALVVGRRDARKPSQFGRSHATVTLFMPRALCADIGDAGAAVPLLIGLKRSPSKPRPPSRSPGDGRSWITSRRKRNSAAGRPPVAVDVSPVGSTRAAVSTRRRKFCLCRWRPEIASTVSCSSVSVNSGAISSKITGRYFSLARSRAMAVARMRRWSSRIGSPSTGSVPRAQRRLAAVAPRLLHQPGFVEELVAVERLLLVPRAAAAGEALPQPLAPRQRARRLVVRARRSPIRRAAGGSRRRGSAGRPSRQSSHGKKRYHGSKPAPVARSTRRRSGMRVSAR